MTVSLRLSNKKPWKKRTLHLLAIGTLFSSSLFEINATLSAAEEAAAEKAPAASPTADATVNNGKTDEPVAVAGAENHFVTEATLNAPLPTVATAPIPWQKHAKLAASLSIPHDAPTDLSVTAYVADQHGRWHQSDQHVTLPAGEQHVQWDIGPQANLQPIGHGLLWNSSIHAEVHEFGLVFSSTQPTTAEIQIRWSTQTENAEPPAQNIISEPKLILFDAPAPLGRTGQRWELPFQPAFMPANPFDPDEFQADLVVMHPDGTQTIHPAFYQENMTLTDVGNREHARPNGTGYFVARWRPLQAGSYQAQLSWSQAGIAQPTIALGAIEITGSRWDRYVRIDQTDPRFFSRQGEFFWPVGVNINAISDIRGLKKTPQKRMTPERGSLAYEAYLERCAAIGITTIEIWMSSFNLGLEWVAHWPEFRGLGRYNMANAERLDRILDTCERLGIVVNLVIHNHGSASNRTDREWKDSPYNSHNDGPFDHPSRIFSDPLAQKYFAQHRRYIIGRWADHPAILAWKMWSEVNLTAAGKHTRPWHRQASQAWHQHDPYGRLRTTHWAGNYRSVDRGVAEIPLIDFVCINAYHNKDSNLSQLLFESTSHPTRGLATTGKPILVTEYGGGSQGGNADRLKADHLQGPFAGFTAGLAGAPMSWWVEFIDQTDFFSPFIAINHFIADEDLRSTATSRGQALRLFAEDLERNSLPDDQRGAPIFVSAWARPGRLLGYMVDAGWAKQTSPAENFNATQIRIANNAAPGRMRIEWWDADRGRIAKQDEISHPGGELFLQAPSWSRHLAWKCYRLAEPAQQQRESPTVE
jgi:hypothetical protein